MTAKETLNALWLLSEEYASAGNIRNAILCLEAVVQQNLAKSPEEEATTRLRLASILISYTENLDVALTHLNKATILLSSATTSHEMKLKLHYFYTMIYETTEQTPKLIVSVTKGLEIAKSSDMFINWYYHFQMKHSMLNASKSPEEALNGLEDAIQLASSRNNTDMEILFSLSKVQLYLRINNMEQAHIHLLPLEQKLKDFEQSTLNSQGDDIQMIHLTSPVKSPNFHKRQKHDKIISDLYIQLYTITACYLLQLAEYKRAMVTIDKLQHQLYAIQDSHDKRNIFDWIPGTATRACTYLLFVLCNSTFGNLEAVTELCAKGLKVTSRWLNSTYMWTSDGSPKPAYKAQINLMLQMQFYLLENRTYVSITVGQFVGAVSLAGQMKQMYQRYSSQGAFSFSHRASLNVIMATLCQATGYRDQAIQHYKAALGLLQNNQDDKFYQVVVFLCLAYINGNNPEGTNDAHVLLNNFVDAMNKSDNKLVRALILFVQSALCQRQGDMNTAREHLQSCLGISNGSLAHTHITAMALNILGSTFLKQNFNLEQSQQVLKSALGLAHRSGDLNTKLLSLQLLSALYTRNNDSLNQTYNMSYLNQTVDVMGSSLKNFKDANVIRFLEDVQLNKVN